MFVPVPVASPHSFLLLYSTPSLSPSPHSPSTTQLLLHPWVKGDAAKQEPVQPEVFRRLRTFNARRKFRAAAYASIVSNQLMSRTRELRRILGGFESLSSDELKDLHTHFKTM